MDVQERLDELSVLIEDRYGVGDEVEIAGSFPTGVRGIVEHIGIAFENVKHDRLRPYGLHKRPNGRRQVRSHHPTLPQPGNIGIRVADIAQHRVGMRAQHRPSGIEFPAAVRQLAARVPTYVTLKEVKKRWDLCPLKRLKLWMEARGWWQSRRRRYLIPRNTITYSP